MSCAPSASIVAASNCVIDDGTSVSIAPTPRPAHVDHFDARSGTSAGSACSPTAGAGLRRRRFAPPASRSRRARLVGLRRSARCSARRSSARAPGSGDAVTHTASSRERRAPRAGSGGADEANENRIGTARLGNLMRLRDHAKRESSPMRAAASNPIIGDRDSRLIRAIDLLRGAAAGTSSADAPATRAVDLARRDRARRRSAPATRYCAGVAARSPRRGAARRSQRDESRALGAVVLAVLRHARTEGGGIASTTGHVLGPPLDPFDAEQDAFAPGTAACAGREPPTAQLRPSTRDGALCPTARPNPAKILPDDAGDDTSVVAARRRLARADDAEPARRASCARACSCTATSPARSRSSAISPGRGSPGDFALPRIRIPARPGRRTSKSSRSSGQGSRTRMQVRPLVSRPAPASRSASTCSSARSGSSPRSSTCARRSDLIGVVHRAVKLQIPSGAGDLSSFRLISLTHVREGAYDGIGPGLELEVDAARLGPFVSSVYVMGRGYHLFGDLDDYALGRPTNSASRPPGRSSPTLGLAQRRRLPLPLVAGGRLTRAARPRGAVRACARPRSRSPRGARARRARVCAALLLVAVGQPIITDDLWWHLALGRAFAAHGPVARRRSAAVRAGRPALARVVARRRRARGRRARGGLPRAARAARGESVAAILALAWSLLRRASGSRAIASLGTDRVRRARRLSPAPAPPRSRLDRGDPARATAG